MAWTVSLSFSTGGKGVEGEKKLVKAILTEQKGRVFNPVRQPIACRGRGEMEKGSKIRGNSWVPSTKRRVVSRAHTEKGDCLGEGGKKKARSENKSQLLRHIPWGRSAVGIAEGVL